MTDDDAKALERIERDLLRLIDRLSADQRASVRILGSCIPGYDDVFKRKLEEVIEERRGLLRRASAAHSCLIEDHGLVAEPV